MKKENNKIEEIEMQLPVEDGEIEETIETIAEVKPRWSLKKKLAIGGAVIAGLLLGAFALGHKSSDDSDDNCDAALTSGDEEIPDAVIEEICEEQPVE